MSYPGFVVITSEEGFGSLAAEPDPQPLYVERESLGVKQELGKNENFARGDRFSYSEDLTDKGVKPSGELTYEFRPGDLVKPLFAHFQGGRAEPTDSYRYLFYPVKGLQRNYDSGNYSLGTYGVSPGRVYSVSICKKLTGGTPYVFRGGVVDKMEFNFNATETAKVTCNFLFTEYSLGDDSMDVPPGTLAGTYSTELPVSSSVVNVLVDGTAFPIETLSIVSDQGAQEIKVVGARNPIRYLAGQHTVKGKLAFDLPDEALSYLGSALAMRPFSIEISAYSGPGVENINFSLPVCVRQPFDFTSPESDITPKGLIPFEAFASEGTPSLSVALETQYRFVPMLNLDIQDEPVDPSQGTLTDDLLSGTTITDY